MNIADLHFRNIFTISCANSVSGSVHERIQVKTQRTFVIKIAALTFLFFTFSVHCRRSEQRMHSPACCGVCSPVYAEEQE